MINKIYISIFILLLLVCVKAYSQNDTIKVNQQDSLGNKIGLWITYYDTLTNDSIKEKIYFENGKKNGIAEFYNKKGEITARHTYKNDTLNGRMVIYESKAIQHYYVYSMGNKVWYGVVENGILGYAIIYIEGVQSYNYSQTEDCKFHGIGTSNLLKK